MSNACLKSVAVHFVTRMRPLISSPLSRRGNPSEKRPLTTMSPPSFCMRPPVTSTYEFWMTRPASPSPQLTSNARMSSATKCPSTRGRLSASVITPENSAVPPTVIALVGAPNAVIMPASTRSLSCRSVLVTWNGMRELSPHAVRPLNVTSVSGVENRPSENSSQCWS